MATPNWQTYLLIGFLLTTGSMIVTWLGEQITDKGYGNGVSMIIFAGIVAAIPGMIKSIYVDYFVNVPSSRITSSIIFVTILIIAVLLIVYFTTFVQQAEYKIPIQYTKIAQGAPSSSYLPLKVNPAGVIPVIFASSITAAPAAIFQFLTATGHNTQWVRVAQSLFATTTASGIVMYALLIILFTFFYTFVQINPENCREFAKERCLYSWCPSGQRYRRIHVQAASSLGNSWFTFLRLYFDFTDFSKRFIWIDRCCCFGWY